MSATRADLGQTIRFGYFRLSLNYETLTDIDPETRTQTDLIPYNATAAFVRISNIRRCLVSCLSLQSRLTLP